MQRAAFAAMITTATALAAACGSFGEGNGAAPPDAGDATSSEDAAPTSDGGLTGDCSTVFHEGFDVMWTAPWENETGGGGSLAHVADGGYEGGALRAMVDAPDGGGTAAQLEREVPGAIPKSVALSFAMKIPQSNSGYFELGCTLQLHGQTDRSYLNFMPELDMGQLSIDDNAQLAGVGVPTGGAARLGPPVPDKWYSIRLELHDITTTTANAIAFVDGVQQLRRTFAFPEPPVTLRVKCGFDHADDGAEGTVLVDDVKLDVCH